MNFECRCFSGCTWIPETLTYYIKWSPRVQIPPIGEHVCNIDDCSRYQNLTEGLALFVALIKRSQRQFKSSHYFRNHWLILNYISAARYSLGKHSDNWWNFNGDCCVLRINFCRCNFESITHWCIISLIGRDMIY